MWLFLYSFQIQCVFVWFQEVLYLGKPSDDNTIQISEEVVEKKSAKKSYWLPEGSKRY